MCGVALGLAGTAGILSTWSEWLPLVPALLSAALLALFVVRCIAVRGSLGRDLSAPVSACVLGTFPMAVQILSQYLVDLGTIGVVVLAIGTSLQICIMAWMALAVLPRSGLKGVHAAVFVPFVGIAATGISAPVLGLEDVGAVCTCVALALAFPLMALVIWRYVSIPVTADAERPLFCISAAPFAICTVAAGMSPGLLPEWLRLFVYILALVCFIAVVTRIPSILRLGFMPSFASMTFPLVISATATRTVSWMLGGAAGDALYVLFIVQAILAVTMVAYVLVRMLALIAGPVTGASGHRRRCLQPRERLDPLLY